LLLNTAQVYATSRVQVYQDGFKLNGTYQLLVYYENIDYWAEAQYYKAKGGSFDKG